MRCSVPPIAFPTSLPSGTLLLILTPLFLLSSPASAQVNVQAGVKAGGTIMTSVGDPARPVDGWRRGVAVGGVATVDIVGPLAAQLELNYVQKGAQILVRGPADGLIDEIRTLDYIEIPFLAKVQAPIGSSFSPSLFAGPTTGFLINGEDTRRSPNELTPGATEHGITVGGDVAVYLNAESETAVVLDIRYTFGLTEYNDVLVGLLGSQRGTFRNQGATVTLGVHFDLSSRVGTR